jgi:hypothetical protein
VGFRFVGGGAVGDGDAGGGEVGVEGLHGVDPRQADGVSISAPGPGQIVNRMRT